MFNELKKYTTKPKLYAPSTNKFWDDEHISKGMLAAHLNPNWNAATRKPEFLDKSVNWISEIAPSSQYKLLLDLGCGPGLYAERFNSAGYSVTGVDFSKRSIAYAKEQTLLNKSTIEYHYQNYLTIDYIEQFDLITLIYCDYAALSITDRLILLRKVYQALKPNGKFIFDVFTPLMRKKESHSWEYYKESGFFSEKPHICLESVYHYDDEDNTELRQSIVITEEAVNCYNIWDHFFTKEALLSEIQTAGFGTFEFYGDIAGKEFSDSGETICGVLTK
ncbi:MAG: class I SAM-dependent methyltransferase [Clostridium sp.]|nr:class I SAM-dependent methyltransferase [Clostridium sp.]